MTRCCCCRTGGAWRDEFFPNKQRGTQAEADSPGPGSVSGVPFILIGSSSEVDPRVCHWVVDAYGQPILVTENLFFVIFISGLGDRLGYAEIIGTSTLEGDDFRALRELGAETGKVRCSG